MDNLIKSSTQHMRSEIIKIITAITNSMAMTNIPKINGEHYEGDDGSIIIPIDNTLKELLKPFAMT